MSGTEGEATAPRGLDSTWRIVTLVVMAVLGAAVLVALVLTLSAANRQRDRALGLQIHSYEVMILARTLSGTIARSEASLGRYVISGDKSLGRLYYDQWQLAGDQLDKLDQETRDNGEQKQRIKALRASYNERGEELALTALSTNYKKNDQALARYYAARKAPALARINALLDQIIAREHVLLTNRTNSAMQSVQQSSGVARILAGFGILIVLGAVALGGLTVQALAQRATARAEADAERERSEELEEAIAKATADLREQEAKLRQVQKMEAVGQLTGGIAHDFNNMLSVVLGGLELAQRHLETGSGQAPRHIESAIEGTNRAAALTRRLLTFSREEALQPEAVEAGALILGMSDLLDRTLGGAISVVVKNDGAGWLIRTDPHQLENAILNLAVNARDAMDGRGELTIETGETRLEAEAIGACPAGDYVTIAVSDSGCGMTADILEHVFEPFFTTKPVGKGTGLGLSQIFGFVRQSDGEIGIRSGPGQGTTVTIYLPRHIADVQPSGIVEALPVAPTRSADAPLNILVVEDDPRVLAATIGAIEDLGHTIIACDDPLTAPAMLAEATSVDLIVSDVRMPGQTGPEMIAALPPRFAAIPVLFVTGFAGDANTAEFGGRPVLRKPFTIAALERAIGEATGGAGTRPESVAAE